MAYLSGGQILTVDLTTGKIRKESSTPYIDRMLGGRGVNSLLLYERVGPEVKPLDPANHLIFGTGALTGTLFPAACRTDVAAKSPVTGAIGNANIGGYWGPELKYAGYDHLVIEGKAPRPVYLYINDDEVEIRDAKNVWGKSVYETHKVVREEIGEPSAQLMCIGPAGERLVSYSTINSSMGHVAGRTGLGMVMGSKNLKAVAVRGRRGIQVADPPAFLTGCQRLHEVIRTSPEGPFRSSYEVFHKVGLCAGQDFEYSAMFLIMNKPWPENFSLGEFAEKNQYKRVGCFGCPLACLGSYKIPGSGGGVSIKCSPYANLTWDLRIKDLHFMLEAMRMIQAGGLDARGVSNVIAWLMELSDRGIISENDTDGLSVRYGNKEATLEMIRKIICREGVGDLLADGLVEASRRIGRGSEEYIVHCKGSPIDAHIPALRGLSLAAAVAPNGDVIKGFSVTEMAAAFMIALAKDEAEIQNALTYWLKGGCDVPGLESMTNEDSDPRLSVGKAAYVFHNENQNTIGDIMGVCLWVTPFMTHPITAAHIAELISIGSGHPVTVGTLIGASIRNRHLQRAFEIREGKTREFDKPSKRFYQQINPDKAELMVDAEEMERLKDEYYRMRQWDVMTGCPTRETLDRCGLTDVADDLERRGLLPH